MLCPCDSKKNYDLCCQPLHEGAEPKTCEELMRSRYSAYAIGLVNYIIETTHSKSRPADLAIWRDEIQAFCKRTAFTGLQIEEVTGERVTFFAQLKRGDIDVSFREKSSFAEENGRLVYVEGTITQ